METKEQLTLLAEISRLEAKVREAENKLKVVPQKANDAQDAADELKTKVDNLLGQRLDIEKRQREMEQDLHTQKDHLKKWNLRLDKIKNEREHGALQSEIGTQRRAISRLENDILELMEEAEGVEKERAKLEEKWTDAESHAESELAEVKDELDALNQIVSDNRGAADKLLERLPAPVVAKYKRIAERRAGQAIGIIVGETCSACRVTLPPQQSILVYRGDVLDTCPSCSRILVHEAMTKSDAVESATEAAGGAGAPA